MLKFVKTFSSFEFEDKVITLFGVLSRDDVAKCKKSNVSLDK